MENIMKKSVAIIALAALIIAVTCCFAFSLPLNAERLPYTVKAATAE